MGADQYGALGDGDVVHDCQASKWVLLAPEKPGPPTDVDTNTPSYFTLNGLIGSSNVGCGNCGGHVRGGFGAREFEFSLESFLAGDRTLESGLIGGIVVG